GFNAAGAHAGDRDLQPPDALLGQLAGAQWGVADGKRAVMVVTISDFSDPVGVAFSEATMANGKRLDEALGERDLARRLALTTPVLAKAIGDKAAWSLGRTWHLVTSTGVVARSVDGFDVNQSGHHLYLHVYFDG